MTDLLNFVALSLLPSSCWRVAAERLRAGFTAEAALEFVLAGRARHEADKPSALRSRAARAMETAQAKQITAVAWNDPSYPVALTTIPDPPFVLWLCGLASTLHLPAVAIVGARAASAYALAVAARLAGDLASAGLGVVSGLARGVDSAAHRGALANEGATVGVLGSGVDAIYPPEHVSLAAEMQRNGAVVSELVPGTRPQPHFFPLRNRIISGLSRAVVVVEAGEKSGSLITARCALEHGRDVLAVPGSILSGRNRGAHALLRDGAAIAESADDILEQLGMAARGRHAAGDGVPPRMSTAPDPILACLTPGEPSDLDDLAGRSGLTPARLLPRLFELELQGAITRIGGGRFVRIDSSC